MDHYPTPRSGRGGEWCRSVAHAWHRWGAGSGAGWDSRLDGDRWCRSAAWPGSRRAQHGWPDPQRHLANHAPKRPSSGRCLFSVTGFALASFSAYLGGELSYSRGVGVNHTASEQGPTEYTAAVALDELTEGKPLRVEVVGVPVMLVKQGEKIAALGATCPHAGGPLDQGTIEGDQVTCPWHGSAFCLSDGKVLRGPARDPALALEARVRDGMVEIRQPER